MVYGYPNILWNIKPFIMKNKEANERLFIEESFNKLVNRCEDSIKTGIGISNVLVILNKDFSVKIEHIQDKNVKEIRNIVADYDMIGYLYAVDCVGVNRHTHKQRQIISIGFCKSNIYKSIDIEYKDKKIINRTIKEQRTKDEVDVLDIWGSHNEMTII